MTDKGYTLDQVLAWVNRERNLFGETSLYKLPDGIPKSACDCPIAKALGCLVDGTNYTPPFSDSLSFTFTFPEYIRAFLADFDEGNVTLG